MTCNCSKKLQYAYIVKDVKDVNDELSQIIEIKDYLQDKELQSKIQKKN